MIHPYWKVAKENPEIVEKLKQQSSLRVQYSHDGKYMKINYWMNAPVRLFEEYPWLKWCRGDVVRMDTGEIVSKAPNKFWTLGQEGSEAKDFDWDNILSIYTKMDGHMILPFVDGIDVRMTSRWSFESDTVKEAEKYNTPLIKSFVLACHDMGIFPLFELITPMSFIKVKYDEADYGLWLTNIVDINGKFIDWSYFNTSGLKVAKPVKAKTLTELVDHNAKFQKFWEYEGVVVTFRDGKAVKLKTASYMDSGIDHIMKKDVEAIYEAKNDGSLDEKISILPNVTKEEILAICNKIDEITADAGKFLDLVKTNKFENRKDMAIFVQQKDSSFMAYVMADFDCSEDKKARVLKNIIINKLKKKEEKEREPEQLRKDFPERTLL